MKRFLALFALLAAWPGHAAEPTHYSCNLNAMTPPQRTVHAQLAGSLFSAIQEKRELPSGYAFRLPSARWQDAATWAGLERRCCPFFAFELAAAPNDGPLWLRITGGPGAKAFMKEEFGL